MVTFKEDNDGGEYSKTFPCYCIDNWTNLNTVRFIVQIKERDEARNGQ
ncbi:uncharacterized protein G2W53_019647 [Senna tora]|uniref:Uncharacterized protein n=1 Tax=Senna tora TaxID=362788 RepID=A0A834WPD6_9FABA|nr:uncharacterized protein G2W53_019647 [Senna tora]